jgi:hypothetical protein
MFLYLSLFQSLMVNSLSFSFTLMCVYMCNIGVSCRRSVTSILLNHGYVLFVVSTTSSNPRSWLITGFLTRVTPPMSQVWQELLTLQGHLSPHSPVFGRVRVFNLSLLLFCVFFCRSLFVLFLLTIALSVFRFTTSDYPFDIFNLILLFRSMIHGPCGFLGPKNLKIIRLSNILTLSVLDEGYFKNASCALNLISTFLLLSQDRYLCWWTISPCGYHQPSSQCLGTDMVY